MRKTQPIDNVRAGFLGTRTLLVVAGSYAVFQRWRVNISHTPGVRVLGLHEFGFEGYLYRILYVSKGNQLKGILPEDACLVYLEGWVNHNDLIEIEDEVLRAGFKRLEQSAENAFEVPEVFHV